MSLGTRWYTPFFSGAAASVGALSHAYPVGVAGRPYMVDTALPNVFGYEWVPVNRTQSDQSYRPGKQTLNPEQLWRRTIESWHDGSGQTYYDRDDSLDFRYATSKGINPWTKYGFELLNDTTLTRSTTSTNLLMATAGTYLYVLDGNQAYWTTDLSSFTPAMIYAGEGVTSSPTSLCSDGYTVYVALGGNGIHTTTRGAVSSSHYNALAATLVGYVKGRLMAAVGNAIYNVTASGAAPAALFTHANTDFTWVGFAEGANTIYAAGYSGDKSLIYRTAVKPDGTALDIPVVAAQLPDGEIVRGIAGYLGYLLVGSDKGVRFATADSAGGLTLGALIPTGSAVRCFEGQDRYVWYGLTNYDATSTGLGRLDLQTFTDTTALTPAYATDLMATGQGNVLDVTTFAGVRVFTVSGLGLYKESTNKVSSGTLTTGEITYGLADNKVPLYVDLRHDPLAGQVSVAMSVNGGTYTSIGVSSTAGTLGTPDSLTGPETSGERFQIQLTLTRSASVTTTGPRVTRVTLRAHPNPERIREFSIPLLLNERMEDLEGNWYDVDVAAERAFLADLIRGGAPLTLQVDGESPRVLATGGRWLPMNLTSDKSTYQGTYLMQFKETA